MIDQPVWDNEPWTALDPLQRTVTADVCVVGLGGSGLAAVDEALSRGSTVVGVDAGGVASGAAGRNGGFLLAGLAPFYHVAREQFGHDTARMAYEATRLQLRRIMRSPYARRTGSLRIAVDEDEMEDVSEELDALNEDGFEAVEYQGPEGTGLLIPENGVFNPLQRCRAEALTLIDRGARLYEESPARSIEPGLVKTPLGVVEAEAIIVAVDGRLEGVFPELSDQVRTARLEMLATEPIEPVFSRPVYTSFGYMYYQQLPTGSIALGGMRDRHMESSWSTESGPTPAVQSDLDGYLSSIGVTAPVSHRWAGLAAYTADRRPILREIRDGVWVVGAYSGHGNVLGSMYARTAVRAAAGEEYQPIL